MDSGAPVSQVAAATADAAGEPVLSVIIVAWNVRDLVLQCIRSVYERGGSIPLEILLTDNGSEDGTVEAVAEKYPEVRIIANATNVGFPRSNNQALALARGRYVLFLNSDTVVGEGTLATCIEELEQDASVGMVTCRLMLPDGRVQYEAGRNPYLLRHAVAELFYLNVLLARSRFFGDHLLGYWDHRGTRDVEAIMGAFMMVRRPVALAVGGLPEDLFMFHEDLSFCLRIRKLGHRIRYLGDVETLHLTNQTTRKHRLRWYLLEGEWKCRLVREAQGPVAAAVARALLGLRSLIRLGIALVAVPWPLPALRRFRTRNPRVFDVERHFLHVLWAISPRLVRGLQPSEAQRPRSAPRVEAPAA